MESDKKQRLINIALVAVVLLAFGAVAYFYLSQCKDSTCPGIEEFVRGFGAWAPLAYALIYIASAPVPFIAPLLSAAGGVLFGTLWGTIYTIVIATASSLIPFALARRLGADWVEDKLKGRKLDDYYQQSEGSGGFLFVVLMRLIPMLPWEVQNYVAGLSKVNVFTFILATMVGIIPGTFSLVFLGASIGDPTSWQFWVAIAFKAVTALVPLVAIWVRRRKNKGAEEQSV